MTTLYQIIQSELIKSGHSEFEEEQPATDIFPFGKFAFYNKDYQFTEKIMNFDADVQEVISYIFHGLTLDDPAHDEHFKKMFLYRFVNRHINRQTIEAFKMELVSTFMSNQSYINRVYQDIDKYVENMGISENQNKQSNKQKNEATSTTDNRQAFADLPQSSVNLNVDDDVMERANDNTISKNKQKNTQQTDGETTGNSQSQNKSYQLDTLIKSNGIMARILDTFDRKCFLQIW